MSHRVQNTLAVLAVLLVFVLNAAL